MRNMIGIAARAITTIVCVFVYSGFVTAADSDGVSDLHRLVDDTCECGAAHADGMAAALSCTDGPREFGRLKVHYRNQWNDAARTRVSELEKVIEHCLSHAVSARDARDQMGLKPIRADGSVPQVYWQRTTLEQAGAKVSDLVRVETNTGERYTGVIATRNARQIELRIAQRDGGGQQTVAVNDITRLWTFVVNTP